MRFFQADRVALYSSKKNKNEILFVYPAPWSSQELVQKCPCIPGSNWNLEMLVFKERGNPVPGEKPLGAE